MFIELRLHLKQSIVIFIYIVYVMSVFLHREPNWLGQCSPMTKLGCCSLTGLSVTLLPFTCWPGTSYLTIIYLVKYRINSQ